MHTRTVRENGSHSGGTHNDRPYLVRDGRRSIHFFASQMTEPLDFQNIRILVVGDVMLDRYWWGDVDRISPEAPVPIVRLNRSTLVAGGAANVAANVTGLG